MLALVFVLYPIASAEPGIPLKEKFQFQGGKTIEEFQELDRGQNYSEIEEEYIREGILPTEGIEIQLDNHSLVTSEGKKAKLAVDVGGKKEEAVLWQDEEEWLEWSFHVEKGGLYEIHVEYYALPGSELPIERSLIIDGEVPFKEAHNIQFLRGFVDDGEPRLNSVGDEVRPRQKEVFRWRRTPVYDSQGFYKEPLLFSLSEGSHTLRLEYIDQPMAISGIWLKSPDRIPTYAEVKKEYEAKGYREAGRGTLFEAESTVTEKSDSILRRETDYDPVSSPMSDGNRILNVMGGWRWKKGNQTLSWKFEVPETGLYKIGMRVAQIWGDGMPVHRQIAIDGKVPFQELLEYSFEYDKKWRTEPLKDKNGEPFLFYLTEGTHEISMTVKMGFIKDIVHSLDKDILTLSRVIRQIVMITGDPPDIHYDYELETSIPDLMDNLKELAGSMQEKYELLNDESVKIPAMANNFLLIKDQLDDMIADPFTIPRKLNDLNNALTSLSTWYRGLQDQPLLLDYFLVSPPAEKWGKGQSNIFQRLVSSFKNLFRSFYKDYDRVAGIHDAEEVSEEDVISVWVSRGMEWGEIMKEIADEDFTAKTGKYIKMNILPPSQLEAGAVNALMLAITSGKAPDVAVGVGANSPVEFAIRNAVVDLTQFPDYEEVVQRFIPGGLIPYQYQGGLYALPETMNFRVMFYRTDILDELKISIPDTWEDLYNYTLPQLYQNGLEFYYLPDLSPFLFQQGGSFYNEDGTRTGLDTPEAYTAFKELTDLYTSYGIPVAANFFNRMRTGEMPIGIADFYFYIQLHVAAPELVGRWSIAPIPGTRKEDGSIDRSVGGIASQACMIMADSEKKDIAWEFIDWWTSDEVQTRYGRELEAVIGMEARWNTANIAAFDSLPWRKNDMEVITRQLEWGKDMPVVLGGYFTGRHLTNAWNRIVIGEMPVRDSLEKAVKDINKELKSRQEEHGIYITEQGRR
jgi:ABC-type glycerol-3-phosphate transport system substrate-binding protein